MSAKELLLSINACPEAIRFVNGKTIKESWEKCQRGDWMLFFYAMIFTNEIRKLTLTKAYCANTVRHLMNDKRSIKAVDVAIKFGYGFATLGELKSAANAAAYADAADAAYAAYAAYAAAADADVAYASAAYAAYAAAADAADAAYAKKQNQLLTADICRQFLDISSLYEIGE